MNTCMIKAPKTTTARSESVSSVKGSLWIEHDVPQQPSQSAATAVRSRSGFISMGGSRHDKSRKPGINPKLSGHIDCTHGRDLYWLMMLVISERAALMPVITPHGTRYYAIVSSMSPRRWRRFGASSWVNGSKSQGR